MRNSEEEVAPPIGTTASELPAAPTARSSQSWAASLKITRTAKPCPANAILLSQMPTLRS